ncbi:Tol-Pal system beta propeller repeat protein TolB [Turicibacter sanguinis]|nr:Tol-Pal system beta propeller repeat protein TolB [Turicibacter sanguinis]
MKKVILLFILFMLPSTSVFAASSVVAIKENEIVAIHLEQNNKVITLNKGEDFFNPKIFDNKQFVAYQDLKSNVYLSKLNDPFDTIFQMSDVKSYTLYGNNLIFSKSEGGIFLYDMSKNKVISLIEKSKYYYDELTINSQGLLFAKKYLIREYSPLGIIQYDLNKKTESLIIDYIPITKDDIGMDPSIAKLSTNGELLYIWCEPNSASQRMDGVPLCVYDVKTKEFKTFNQIKMLVYPDNLAIHPTNDDLIAVINGTWRMMNENKQLQLFNPMNEQIENITKPGIVAMSPSFSQDGTRLYYSAGIEVKDQYTTFVPGSNQIYVYDLNTKKTEKLTNDLTDFDFYPQEIENEELLFLRFDKDHQLSLVRRENKGEESIILTNLLTTNFEVYGHLDSYQILSVKY